MRVYFGTVIRNAPMKSGGELVCLDWKTKTVCARVPICPTNPDLCHDPNPRGNGRGCRGLQICGDEVIASNYHSLLVFDRDLRFRRRLSHGLMAGIHETYSEDGKSLWVTSTPLEATLEYDLESGQLKRSFWPREMPGLQQALHLTRFEIDKNIDNRERYLHRKLEEDLSHLHINAISSWRGEYYALLNSFGVIANLSAGEVVVKHAALKGGHNLLITEDGTAITNDTWGRRVMFFDLSTRNLVDQIDLHQFPWVGSLMKRARRSVRIQSTLHRVGLAPARPGRELFVRGLALHGDQLFVGMSPASILSIDWKRKSLVDAFLYASSVNACVHGLEVVSD